MNLLTGLYGKLIGAGIAVLLILSAGAYIHHKGAASQKAKDSKVIAALQVEVAGYHAQAEVTARAMQQINAQAEAAQQDAATQKAYADAALQQVQIERTTRAKSEAKRAGIVAKVTATPAADTKLSQKLVPELAADY